MRTSEQYATLLEARAQRRVLNILELVVIDQPHSPAVMHAMQMRSKYRRLLPKER